METAAIGDNCLKMPQKGTQYSGLSCPCMCCQLQAQNVCMDAHTFYLVDSSPTSTTARSAGFPRRRPSPAAN